LKRRPFRAVVGRVRTVHMGLPPRAIFGRPFGAS
jgi:hypothetical protein